MNKQRTPGIKGDEGIREAERTINTSELELETSWSRSLCFFNAQFDKRATVKISGHRTFLTRKDKRAKFLVREIRRWIQADILHTLTGSRRVRPFKTKNVCTS